MIFLKKLLSLVCLLAIMLNKMLLQIFLEIILLVVLHSCRLHNLIWVKNEFIKYVKAINGFCSLLRDFVSKQVFKMSLSWISKVYEI